MNDLLKAAVLGVVEGVTEFLPISSTGHLIIVNDFIGFGGDFANSFKILIQLGAVLAVVVYFRRRLFPFGASASSAEKNAAWDIWMKTAVALVPAVVIGTLAGEYVEARLFNHIVVAVALVAGGAVLVAVDRRGNGGSRIRSVGEIGYRTAFLVGLLQCVAMVPGVSRSAATILGAMALGASRVAAAEFSFFLAMPTLSATFAHSLLELRHQITADRTAELVVGFVMAFVASAVVVRPFLGFVRRVGFAPFAWYRIVAGAVLLWAAGAGWL